MNLVASFFALSYASKFGKLHVSFVHTCFPISVHRHPCQMIVSGLFVCNFLRAKEADAPCKKMVVLFQIIVPDDLRSSWSDGKAYVPKFRRIDGFGIRGNTNDELRR